MTTDHRKPPLPPDAPPPPKIRPGAGRNKRPHSVLPEKPSRTRQNVIAILLTLGVLGGMVYFWQNPRQATKIDLTEVASQPGRGDYLEYCAYCHGMELDGKSNWYKPLPKDAVQAPPLNADGKAWQKTDDELFRITKMGGWALTGGPSKMPPFEGVLNDQQIRNTIAFIKSSWPDDIRQKHDALK